MIKLRHHLQKSYAVAFIVFLLSPCIILADERIGNLVFNAMQKIQENHQSFVVEVQTIKDARKAAVRERNASKKNFQDSKRDSLDRKEFHAEFCYAQAKYYRALHDEVKLTNQISYKQLGVLNSLNDSIKSGESEINSEGAVAIMEATKPFLENGRSLMNSLAKSRNMISDPVINSKLTSAYQTAKMLSNYIDHIEKNKLNKNMQEAALQQKIHELIDQLNSLYAQTDILMAMIQDKTVVLKMINQLAASEMGMWALTDGKKMINEMTENIINPMMQEYYEADEDLDILTDEVLGGGDNDLYASPSISQKWTKADF